MQIKKTLKKVGAVAGSTLMVGMTMGAAQSLADFPGMFVDEDGTPTSEVVVGSDANTADVVGAVNVAAALGQDTVQTEERDVPAGSIGDLTVNGDDNEATVRDRLQYGITATQYEDLQRNHEYDSDNGLRVTELVDVDTTVGAGFAGSAVDYQAEPRVDVDTGELTYEAIYAPQVEEEQPMYLLGNELELTDVLSDSEVEVGSKVTNRNLEIGDEVEHTDWSAQIDLFDRDNREVTITVYDDGEQVETVDLLSPNADSHTTGDDEASFGDDDQFTVRVTRAASGTGPNGETQDQITLETVFTEQTLEEGEPYYNDDNYEVSNLEADQGAGTLGSVTLTPANSMEVLGEDEDQSDLDDGEVEALMPGDTLEGPEGHFNFEFVGLTDAATEMIDFEDGHTVSFTDGNAFEHSFDLRADDDSGLHTGYNVGDGDTGNVIVESRNGNVPLMFEVLTAPDASSSSGNDFHFEYGAYEEDFALEEAPDSNTIDFDNDGTTGDSTVYHATNTGYGFTPVVADDGEDAIDGWTVGYYRDGFYYFDGGNVPTAESNVKAAVDVFHTDHEATLQGEGKGVSLYGLSEGDNLWVTETDHDDPSHTIEYDFGDNDAHNVVVYDGTDGSNDITAGATSVTVDGDDSDSDQIAGVVAETHGGGTPASTVVDDVADGEETLSYFGSAIDLSDETSVSVEYPEEQRSVHTALGEVTEGETSTGTGDTYDAVTNPDVRGALPDVARLDEEVTSSVRSGSDLILVGGPGVNSLVSNLAEDHDDVRTQSEWQNMHNDEFQVQLVEDAFTDGNHALIVAGYQAQDTRAAASYVSNWRENADELEGAAEVTRSRSEYPSQ